MKTDRRHFLQATAAAAVLGSVGVRPVRAQGGPIRIGLMLPMSGIGAEAGAAWLAGARVAVAQWNAKGGVLKRQVELVVRDDKFSSAGAVAAARELAGSGVNLLIGGSQSPMALATAPILPELKALMVAPCPTVMSLTHEGFQRNFFRLSWNAYIAFAGIGNMLTDRFKEVQTWSCIVPDSENGRDMARFFSVGVQRAAQKAGRTVKVLDPVFASLNKADYKVEINSLMNAPSQGLFVGLTAAPCISLLQQGRAVGMDRKFKVIGDAGTELMIAKAMQKSTPANLWSISYWVPGTEAGRRHAMSNALYEDYVKLTGDRNPPSIVQSSHRCALALFNGIEKAGGTDTDAVIAALEGLEFDTAVGRYHIRKEDHQGLGEAYIAQVGAREADPGYGIVDAIAYREADVAEPPSPGKPLSM
ncbi:ABC transporter substrate-binding protein [Pseudacidovorax intermedius]|uniref:Branched-chain amino acid transport system substrate-binding protein n=1 Tax=Pseudacidovorax intermedius TaxID=433924 RepID=A0A370FB01_9BURK|nr:ABC transporter substrate-binding protein [Pseudacidovorax intermedius]RDI22602.1 branched-chain amino acid transport system substrate-binding protein [Pseudacidovorax intermedius]